MQKTLLKSPIFTLILLTLFIGGCTTAMEKDESQISLENDDPAIGKSTFFDCLKRSAFNIEMERYENIMYGYTIEVPRSWGAIQPHGAVFTDNLYDEMEEIGPLLQSGEALREYLGIHILNKDNTAERVFEEYESLFDFYENFYLKRMTNATYNTNELTNEILTNENRITMKEFIQFEKDGEYLRTYRLMENEKGLYVFTYNRDNSIHQNIIESIELN